MSPNAADPKENGACDRWVERDRGSREGAQGREWLDGYGPLARDCQPFGRGDREREWVYHEPY